MATYDVYQHPRSGKYRAVKQGFCWPAFFFVSLWAFSRRLYLLGLFLSALFLLFLLAEVVSASASFPTNSVATAARVATQVLFALFANNICCWFLRVKGFTLRNSVSASWPSSAIKQHIDAVVGKSSSRLS